MALTRSTGGFMSDPIYPDPSQSGDHIRTLENDRSYHRGIAHEGKFDGLEEISQAWRDNRSTEYLFKKSWADPLARWFMFIGIGIILAVWIYLLTQ